MSEDGTYIQKKRTTALKIIVDEKTKSSEIDKRTFLGNLFDYPEYAEREEVSKIHCALKTETGLSQYDYILDITVVNILKQNSVDITAFEGYKEEKELKFRQGAWDFDERVKEVTGISNETYLHYQFAGSEDSNGATIYYLRFQLETTGKTKTEIKGVHKENVCKLLNYLRMRKVPYSYDCEWSFEGSRACQL